MVRCSRQRRERVGRRLESRGCHEICVRCGAVRDDSFNQFWSCHVINSITNDNIRKSQHFFQRAKRQKNTIPCFLDQWHGPSRVDGGAFRHAMWSTHAWSTIRRETLKEWVKCNCLITFLDGTGGPFSQWPRTSPLWPGCGCSWFHRCVRTTSCFRQRRRSPGRQAHRPQIRSLRWVVGAPLCATQDPLDSGFRLVSTSCPRPREVRANAVGPCSDLWHQYWGAVEYHAAAILVMKVKSRASERSLWSRHQPIWMCAGNEFADRLAAKGAEAHQDSEWTLKTFAGVGNLATTVQWRVATWHVAVPQQVHSGLLCLQPLGRGHRWKSASGWSAHEILLQGRRIGSVKCTKCVHVCFKKQLRVWLQTTCVPWRAKDDALHPFAAWVATSRPAAERFRQWRCWGPIRGRSSPRTMRGKRSSTSGMRCKTVLLHPRLGAMSVHEGHRIFHHRGVLICVKCGNHSMRVDRKLRRDCPGNPSKLGMEVLKRMANRETPRPGQEWPLSVDVSPPTGMGGGEYSSVTRAALWHARWVGGQGRGIGSRKRRCPWVRHVGFKSSLLCFCSSRSSCRPLCAFWAKCAAPGPCLWDPWCLSEPKSFKNVFSFFLFFFFLFAFSFILFPYSFFLFPFCLFCLFVFLSFCLLVFLSSCLLVFLSSCLLVFLSSCLLVFFLLHFFLFLAPSSRHLFPLTIVYVSCHLESNTKKEVLGSFPWLFVFLAVSFSFDFLVPLCLHFTATHILEAAAVAVVERRGRDFPCRSLLSSTPLFLRTCLPLSAFPSLGELKSSPSPGSSRGQQLEERCEIMLSANTFCMAQNLIQQREAT